MSADAEPRVLREVVLDQLTTGEVRAYRMWLPPLADPPRRWTNLSGAIDASRCGSASESWTSLAVTVRKYGVSTSAGGGNIAIGGAPQSGKSTFLQTMMLSAAMTHSPRDVPVLALHRLRWWG